MMVHENFRHLILQVFPPMFETFLSLSFHFVRVFHEYQLSYPDHHRWENPDIN